MRLLRKHILSSAFSSAVGFQYLAVVNDLQASTASILKLAETILTMDTTSVNVQYNFLAA